MQGNVEIRLCKYSLELVEKQEKLSQIIFQLQSIWRLFCLSFLREVPEYPTRL